MFIYVDCEKKDSSLGFVHSGSPQNNIMILRTFPQTFQREKSFETKVNYLFKILVAPIGLPSKCNGDFSSGTEF